MAEEDDSVEQTPGYVAPKKVALDTLKDLDKDDEALNRWKAQLLAGASAGNSSDPRKVIVEKMSFVTAGREDIALDLTRDLSGLKDKPITIKEGSEYRLRITFKIQHEVVSGLKYVHTVHRGPLRVDKSNYMLGSYGPKAESQSAMTPLEEAPSGMLARGTYIVKSKFVDDDNETHLAWEWSFVLKKDWE
eukprot:m.221156 g.221156  ORF g.221156 m.221156 type:complete len:190 (-) comp15731_c0_seq1:107-676(-)